MKMLMIDIVLIVLIVFSDYTYSYRMPKELPALNIPTEAAAASAVSDWGQNFEDKFTDAVVSTQNTYKSPNISIELTQSSYDSGIADSSGEYGTVVSYTLADIYVRNIECLQTAFAQDSYGIGFTEKPQSMSERLRSVLSVNGDSYSKDLRKDNGTVIRNGRVYREQVPSGDTCVLFRDGSMKTYSSDAFDPKQAVRDGAWQSWEFGPSLLDVQGNVKTEFDAPDYIQECHPRTAIGYYEPGHYCLLVVDGRQKDFSRGMYLSEMSRLFAALGCKAAYNLDGGHSSFMLKGNDVASHPYKLCDDLSDGIFICEPEVY